MPETDNRPPEGWGESFDNPTFTVWGPSWDMTPPAKEGYHPHFIGRHGTSYTTWTYRKDETERHNYEPGETTHPMHTDPSCRVCGEPKNAAVHDD